MYMNPRITIDSIRPGGYGWTWNEITWCTLCCSGQSTWIHSRWAIRMIQGLVCEALCTAGLVIAACGRDYYSQNTLGVNPVGYRKLVIMLKWFWGLNGGGYIFVALILMVKATKSRFFSLPTWKHYTLGHFSFFQNWFVNNQTGLCTTGAVSQKGNRKGVKVLQHVQ